LHHYMKLEEMVHVALKVEKQLKWKGTIWQSQPIDPSKPWKPNWKADNITPTCCNYDIKCFHFLSFGHIASQCLKKRVMIMKANNKVDIDGEDEEKICHH
jgi:hypothetical protein